MSFKSKRYTRKAKAFSLAEIMVVLVIIGLLGSVVTYSVQAYLHDAKVKTATSTLQKIAGALDSYHMQYGKYPSRENWIEALTKPSEKFVKGPLEKIPSDPWGNKYEYFLTEGGKDFEVLSYGADADQGGEGEDKDISTNDFRKQN